MDIKRPNKNNIKTIVVKIGSSIICNKDKISLKKIGNIVKQLIKIYSDKIQIVVVTSGAIVAGIQSLGLKKRPETLPGLQAAAAAGQSKLMALYEKVFANKVNIAQILLTKEDMHNRNRYLNARNTIMKLLELGVLPIVNENDTVAVDEIKFGDNDTLSAMVATLIDADLLIILSDVEGFCVPEDKISSYKEYMEFYNKTLDLKPSGRVRVVKNVKKIPQHIEDVCKGTGRSTSVGGMMTKIQAARTITNTGIACIIANGEDKEVLIKTLSGKNIGTYFLPATTKKSAIKRWIGYGSRTKGKIMVDSGAKQALSSKGKSLLASGIIKVEGDFSCKDAVAIADKKGNIFAKGLSYYSSFEINKIKGKKTSQIEKILGFKYYDEVVHRDRLVLV